MAQDKYTILDSWPGLKEDLEGFLSDTDAWVISELKKAQKAKDWNTLDKLIQVMEFVHGINHEH